MSPRPDLEAARHRTVRDLVDDRTRLLFVGINPGLWTAAVDAHFARPGNRFWPALHAAGILDRRLDVSRGMGDEEREYVLSRGVGITNLAPRATARADELDRSELAAGVGVLTDLVSRIRPAVVAVAGVTAYRVAFDRRAAVAGQQPETLAGAALWVVPNPSGLNAHATPAILATAYREAAEAAGLLS